MSSSVDLSQSFPDDWDQRKWKKKEAWLTPTTRQRCKIVVQIVILALFFGYFAGVFAQQEKYEVQGNSVVRAGKDTTLHCNPVHKGSADLASYVWVKDGEVIPGQNGKALSLKNVTREDSGYYRCGPRDSNAYGRGLKFHVYVTGDRVAQPVIHPHGEPVLARNFSLHCFFFEGYVPSEGTVYTWYKDSVELKGHTGYILRFTEVTETDKGTYTCSAWEGSAETKSPPSTAVEVRPLVPPQVRIKPPGPVVKGVRGETLTLTCEVTRAFPEVPANGYSWSYLPSPKDPPRLLEGKGSILTLDPLTLEDRGQYVCQARNDQRPDRSNLNLTGHASVTVDIVYLENLTLTPDLEVNEGDPVTLTCRVDSLPTAQLAWTVRGQEVRHVTDNLDHYVITRAACSDSGSYTCGASNTELPGRDRHATVQLHVNCTQDSDSDTTETEVGAIFHFLLPDWTPMVVVHPGGHDVISVRQDCSYNVSSTFQSRCLQPRCDLERHRLSFTLTNVTEKDEGEYVCLEEESQRRRIPDCSKKLRMKKFILETPPTDRQSSSLIALAICIALPFGFLAGILLGVKHGRSFQNLCPQLMRFMRGGDHDDDGGHELEAQIRPVAGVEEGGNGDGEGSTPLRRDLTFDGLYDKGKVHVLPTLVPPVEATMSHSQVQTEDESQPLLSDPQPSAEQKEFDVKNLLRSTLQNSMSKRANDLPSFLLHNIRIGDQMNCVLVLDKKLGVVVMIVNAVTSPKEKKSEKSVEMAASHLLKARSTLERALQGVVTPVSIKAVLALPCLTHNDAAVLRKKLKILHSHPEVGLLTGVDPPDFRQWAEQLETERGRQLWKSSTQEIDPPNIVYKEVTRRFLTLAPIGQPGDSSDLPDSGESLLLTPAQMEVRESTARLLHIRGPPGSGKTTLLVHRARQWLAEGKAVILAVGEEFLDIQLALIDRNVQRGQGTETRRNIHSCRTVQEVLRAVKVRKGMFPTVEVCLIVDVLSDVSFLKALLPVVRSGNLVGVWSAGWRNPLSGSTDFSKEAQKLGWESAKVPDCIRSTDNTLELLNLLGRGVFPPIPSCSVPRAQDIPAWRVVDHCLHYDYVNTKTSCDRCKKEMPKALPSVKQGLQGKSWIALHTGDPNIFVNPDDVKEASQLFHVSVSYDVSTYLRHETVLAASASRQYTSTSGITDFSPFRTRVIDGVDEQGSPTLHLIRVEDFKGMEREGVILVHWDYRDIIPECQSQGERATRLEEHRRQWIQAASRSTGQVLLLLLTPSPARSLLGLPEVAIPHGLLKTLKYGKQLFH